MNEELQSTNDELQTINDELRERTDELERAQPLPGGGPHEPAARAWSWSTGSCGCWSGTGRPRTCGGCVPTRSIGQHLLNLDIGLPVQRLRPALKACLNGTTSQTQVTLEAINRRGKKIICQVTCSPLLGPDTTVAGAIIVMDEVPEAQNSELKPS